MKKFVRTSVGYGRERVIWKQRRRSELMYIQSTTQVINDLETFHPISRVGPLGPQTQASSENFLFA